MHAYDVIVNFFKQGGFFLYPIALIWAIGIVIAIERFVYLMKVGGSNKRLWDELQPLFEAGNFKQAMTVVTSTPEEFRGFVTRSMQRVANAVRAAGIPKSD